MPQVRYYSGAWDIKFAHMLSKSSSAPTCRKLGFMNPELMSRVMLGLRKKSSVEDISCYIYIYVFSILATNTLPSKIKHGFHSRNFPFLFPSAKASSTLRDVKTCDHQQRLARWSRAEGFNKWTQHGCYGAAGRNGLQTTTRNRCLERGCAHSNPEGQFAERKLLWVVFGNARAK